jgi:hypothetical protein
MFYTSNLRHTKKPHIDHDEPKHVGDVLNIVIGIPKIAGFNFIIKQLQYIVRNGNTLCGECAEFLNVQSGWYIKSTVLWKVISKNNKHRLNHIIC